MLVKIYLSIIILILTLLCNSGNYSYGKENRYTILGKKGTVYLYRNNKLRVINIVPKSLVKNDVIITKNDSSVVLKINKRYIKTFSYSKLVIKDIPLLIYGKLQVSSKKIFNEPHFMASPLPKEGETTKILIWGVNQNFNLSGKIESAGKTIENINFYRINNYYNKALVGIPLGIKEARYIIKISIAGEKNYSLIKYPCYIKKIKYKRGVVRLTPVKGILLQPSKEKSLEQKILGRVLQTPLPKQYWRGKFIYPVKNPRIISEFGKKRRYYIGGSYLYQRFHYGIDLYGKKGTEVFAPNSGIVVFTGKRITTGNTIVIDHGLGVFSLFFHLCEIDVKPGDFVSKGCLIGKVGSTGLAESPHLHWGLLVNMVYVNPVQWIRHRF